jgi:hypothetical protein
MQCCQGATTPGPEQQSSLLAAQPLQQLHRATAQARLPQQLLLPLLQLLPQPLLVCWHLWKACPLLVMLCLLHSALLCLGSLALQTLLMKHLASAESMP